MKLKISENTPSLADWELPAIDKLYDVSGLIERLALRIAEEALRHTCDENLTAFISVSDEPLLAILSFEGLGGGESGCLFVDLPIVPLIEEYASQSKGNAEFAVSALRALADKISQQGD